VGIATGTYFLVKSLSDRASGDPFCHGNICSEPGFDLRSAAVWEGDAATYAFGVGVGATAVGVFLWLTAPHAEPLAHPARLQTGVSVSSRGAALSIRGAW
jgi:hypothetical protein